MPNETGMASRRSIRRRLTLTGAVVGSTALVALSFTAPGSAAPAAAHHGRADAKPGSGASKKHPQNFDVRQTAASQRVLDRRAAQLRAHPTQGLRTLRHNLGVQGVVSIDPLTRTPRTVARLDGFLTGPSSRRPADIALGYVRTRPDVFGLSNADLSSLRLTRSYTDVTGTHHLGWVQYDHGLPVFGNDLEANVTRTGQLVSVLGSPLHAPAATGTATKISAAHARALAVKDVASTVDGARAGAARGTARTTTWSDGDKASLVVFQTVSGPRLAWQTYTTPGKAQMFTHVVDAATGRVLYRHDLVQSDNGSVWEYWPGAPRGGTQQTVNLNQKGWLPKNSHQLAGNTAHVYSDINDNNRADPGPDEEVTPGPNSFKFPFTDFTGTDGPPCSALYRCSWDPKTAGSWRQNRKQDAVQVFYYVSKFHDHLADSPIGFTRTAGNFEAVDGDAVQAQPDDGAATAGDLPDSNHVDNANMGTPPDGTAPIMQMYLFHDPADMSDPFLQTNGGDEADVVYHEYTHGLSNRLVVDAAGNSTLGAIQAGSMGEAWSDWYAMDFLNDEGFQPDTSAPGEVRIGDYVGGGQDLIRTQPLDCPVGSTSAKCPGTPGAGSGGYTYGDFGKIIGGPEVHADGEIWGETLWDLRDALGSKLTESLVTRAMELSPSNPSYLDERNAILQADLVTNRGRAQSKIWSVFAHRGMGYFAGSVDGDDTAPVEDFSMPPAPNSPKGSLTGTVTDDATHQPIAGATVAFGGHASGFPTDYAATTGADGTYTITGIFAGNYPDVFAKADGFDRQVKTERIAATTNTEDWALRRDWASLSGGASVAETNDDTGAPFGCGAAAMFDQSVGIGWSAERHVSGGSVTPVHVTVKLPQPIDISQIAIDPTATCGDGGSASTGPYSVETSTDGVTWTPAASGTFTPADRGHFSTPPLAVGSTAGVQYVRYTMQDSQVNQVGTCPGAFSGCDFIDSRELEVYGAPTP